MQKEIQWISSSVTFISKEKNQNASLTNFAWKKAWMQ